MRAAERRAISIISGVAMLRMLGLFSLLPVVALYAAGLEGATPMLVGLAVGAYGLTQAGLQIPMGALSDRVGRVPVLLGGLAVFAIGSAVAAMADTIQGVILGRLLQGAGAISATLTALIADVTRVEVRTRSMAIYGVGIGLSFLIAMIFGPWFAALFGVRALFAFAFAAALSAALLLVLLPPSDREPVIGEWKFAAAFEPRLLRLDVYVFLLHSILTASFVALPFMLRETLSLPMTEHWQLYVGAITVSLAGTVPLILKDERQGKTGTIAIAVLLVLLGELGLAFFPGSMTGVFAALALFFAGFNFLEAGLPARLSQLAPERSRGAALGVFASAQFLGAFVGGVLGGRLLAGGQPGRVFLVCALLAGIWLAVQLVARQPAAGGAGSEPSV